MHRPLVTFDFDEDGHHVQINITCDACGGTDVVAAPATHIVELTIALIAACGMLGFDLSTRLASVRAFDTPAARREAEARYAGREEREEKRDDVAS